MTEQLVAADAPTELKQSNTGCDLCGRVSQQLGSINKLPVELAPLIDEQVAANRDVTRICASCVELFTRAKTQIVSHQTIFDRTDHVLPTPLRLNADERFTGRGVTIAFLDSGFYAHDDLTQPSDRILGYHSIFDANDDLSSLHKPDVASWHGMMTSVVAAGNGFLSDGFYRGIASQAGLVLVKIGRSGRIPDEHIEQGLEWVLENRTRFGIRVVNISAGGDAEVPYMKSSLCQLVERAVTEGLVVVCAVGNAGMLPGHPVLPPASAPSAISVGGLDDQNSLDRAKRGMYRSSYGPTIDGLQKPEIIAPGIWVAAPILPFTPTADQAELCSKLDQATDDKLKEIIEAHQGVDKDFDNARDLPIPLLRQLITIKRREGNVINQHYKYVDGTSFSAPIVSSVAASVLEANPALTPQQVKRILIDTAERVVGVDVDRQGWGVVAPRKAVAAALKAST